MGLYTKEQIKKIDIVRRKTGFGYLEILNFLKANNWNVELACKELRIRAY